MLVFLICVCVCVCVCVKTLIETSLYFHLTQFHILKFKAHFKDPHKNNFPKQTFLGITGLDEPDGRLDGWGVDTKRCPVMAGGREGGVGGWKFL